MSNWKVLCVESDTEYGGALKIMLETASMKWLVPPPEVRALTKFSRQEIRGVLMEYDLPDASGIAVRAEMKKIKPDVPVLLFAALGSQTRLLLRFFDSYLRNADRPEWAFQDEA